MKPFPLALPRATGLLRTMVAVAVTGALSAPAPLLAAPQAGQVGQAGQAVDSARARELFRKGREEYGKDGHLPQAYAYFLEAWGLQKSFDIAGNLAVVERQLSRYRDAAEHAAFSLANFPAGGTDTQRKALEDLLAEARANVGTITVQVSVEHAAITVDGKPAGESPLPYEVFVEPGSHVIAASAPGCEQAQDTVPTGKGTSHLVKLAPRCGGGPQPPKTPPSTPPTTTTTEGPRPLTIAGFVTSGIGFGLGTAFAILSRTKADSANQQQMMIQSGAGNNPKACAGTSAPTGCSDLGGLRSSEATFASAALWSFVAAGAVAAGTLVYTFAVPRAPATTGAAPAKAARVQVLPLAGPGAGGVMLKGAF